MRLSQALLASLLLMASSAAADTPAARQRPLIPKLVRFDRLDQALGAQLPHDPAPIDMPTLWTRWARSVPLLPLEACEVEMESDLSFVRFSLNGRF